MSLTTILQLNFGYSNTTLRNGMFVILVMYLMICGEDGTRTHDLLTASQTL